MLNMAGIFHRHYDTIPYIFSWDYEKPIWSLIDGTWRTQRYIMCVTQRLVTKDFNTLCVTGISLTRLKIEAIQIIYKIKKLKQNT